VLQAPVRAAAKRTPRRSPLSNHPEILPVAVAALAWAALVWRPPAGPTGMRHSVLTWTGVAEIVIMTIAMMALHAIPGTRSAVFTSGWWRAGRSATEFITGFLASWALLAVLLAPVAGWAASFGAASPASVAGTAPALAVALVICALLTVGPARRRQMLSCDRPMRLRSRGSEPAMDCLRFGARSALRGWPLCGGPMLAMLVAPGNLLVMSVTTALALADRVSEGRYRWFVAAGYVSFAAALVLVS
jgi:Predicted metal-binding integral membrane protein (DUF2182)